MSRKPERCSDQAEAKNDGRPNITISRHIIGQNGTIGIAYVEHVPEMRERQGGEHHRNSLVRAQTEPVKRAYEGGQGGKRDQISHHGSLGAVYLEADKAGFGLAL